MIVQGVYLLPTSAQRLVRGVTIPLLTEEELRTRFEVKGALDALENRWMLPYVSEIVDPLMVVWKGKRYGSAHMNASLKIYHGQPHDTDWWDYISRQTLEVNGQLKNFMVAVRTWPVEKRPSLRVLVRGSRAMMGGGRWHELYAHYLGMYVKDCVIDMYDPAEVTESFEIVSGPNRVKVNRKADLYEGDGSSYDVCIDDAFTEATGTLDWRPQSKFWSLKDHTGKTKPFLHAKEGRRFSTGPQAEPEGCMCRVCVSIAHSTTDERARTFLRVATQLLGRKGCQEVVHGDVQAQADVMARLTQYTTLTTPGEERAAQALSTLLPVVGTGMDIMAGVYDNRLQKSDFVRDKGFMKRQPVMITAHGPVTYIGIDASELPIKGDRNANKDATYYNGQTYVVLTWDRVHPVADEVWIPDPIAKRRFVPSGRVYGRFFHYCRPFKFVPPITSVAASSIKGDLFFDRQNLSGTVHSVVPLSGVKSMSSLEGGTYVQFAGNVDEDTKVKIVGPDKLKVGRGYVLSPKGDMLEANVGFRESTVSFVVPTRQSYRYGVMFVSAKDLGRVATWECVPVGSVWLYYTGPTVYMEYLRGLGRLEVV